MKKFNIPIEFVNEFTKDFNKRLKRLLNTYDVKNFEDFLIGESPTQLTQKRASFLSPLVDLSLKYAAKEMGLDWDFTAEDSYDSTLQGTKLEHKFSLSTSNSWTGHPYSKKVPNHFLIKMEIVGNKIDKLFMCILNLNKCKKTGWYGTSDGSHSFATLKIHGDDIGKTEIIIGGLSAVRKWCKVLLW